MNQRERDDFHKYVLSTVSERSRVLARQLAGSTTVAGRFDLTQVKALEGFLLNAFWLLDHAEVSDSVLHPVIAGKDCS